MSMEKLRATFFEEARSLLQDIEDLVLSIESGNADDDAVHALFRCAHTIKGSAGIFGLDAIVSFAHTAESVLDRLRNRQIEFDGELAALLLECRDHIEALVALAADHGDAADAEATQRGQALSLRLERYLGQAVPQAGAATGAGEPPDAPQAAEAGALVASEAWHISLRFHLDAFRRGINPAAFVGGLARLGRIVHVETLLDDLPEPTQMDPESCYLGFEIDLQTDADKSDIEAELEFLDGDCDICMIPPFAKVAEYAGLIGAQDSDRRLRLGEILVRSGALTPNELDRALRMQSESGQGGEVAAPLGEILIDAGLTEPPLVQAALAQQRRTEERQSRTTQVLKVPSERIDQLIDLVGELVIASSATSTLAAARRDPQLVESASQLHGLIEEVRDVALRMRMVPIGATFARFQRAVRDIAKELGKEIELAISGAETELDKSMVELVADPLMHLVRNSADHGIEAPALRRERGKPARGRLSLNACHDSGSVVIEVADDGGGLDRDRIRAKAVERGLIAADQALSDAEIYRLIFEPGFSTATSVTNLSGRGVGMDVVKRNIEALRGSIEIDSRPGAGTCMRLRLPLTLAIIDGFLVELAGARYVIPLDMLLECIDLPAAERAQAQERGFINLRDRVLPVLWLRDCFAIGAPPQPRESIVVISCNGQQAGLAVDRLLGQQQVVIKPLPAVFRQIRGIGGSTILGDGQVAMILDIPSLVQSLTAAARGSAATLS